MQRCTYSEFTFPHFGRTWQALKNIGLGPKAFGKVDGMEHFIPMGTGSGNGFSVVPNLKRFAFFGIWENREAADHFFEHSDPMHWYIEHSSEMLHVNLKPLKAHGLWNGKAPLQIEPNVAHSGQVAVLTRATIKKRHLPEFWWNVPKVSAFMAGAPGMLHNVGIGEYPLFMQATFSMWDSHEALMHAAYRDTAHARVVKRTRQRGWYAEEMFAQFAIEGIEGHGARFEVFESRRGHAEQ